MWAAGGQDNYFSNVRITHAKPQAVENGSDVTGTWDIQYGVGRFSKTELWAGIALHYLIHL